jgi:hypothetical protein
MVVFQKVETKNSHITSGIFKKKEKKKVKKLN